eukprot:TRINITY_DN249_c0_g2_i2.p1 TRINITY_DN249_c0_g2~~TRINITY_DN249_c0_g2_i2.p1  ORF type:complete len:202 (+),score=61.16 TRINITY_DN249_c0_g2_i2:64-606(+)
MCIRDRYMGIYFSYQTQRRYSAKTHLKTQMDAGQTEFYVSPIAQPLAGEKLNAKILKLVKKMIKQKLVKRGVKEVVKSFRKGATGICIMAADVSPVDVLSHIPVQCENKGIPYIYVKSRMELGVAAQTKRPTSVVLLTPPEDEKLRAKYDKLFGKIQNANPFLQWCECVCSSIKNPMIPL